jgi:hypothetical protein
MWHCITWQLFPDVSRPSGEKKKERKKEKERKKKKKERDREEQITQS